MTTYVIWKGIAFYGLDRWDMLLMIIGTAQYIQ